MRETSNFFVAVCGKTAQPAPPYESLVYLNSTGNLLREKEQRIGRLEGKLIELDQKVLQLQSDFDQRAEWCLQLEGVLKEREAAVLKLQKEYDETVFSLQQSLAELQKEFEERALWAQRLSQESSEKDQRIFQLQREYDERTDWALRLDDELKKTQEQLDKVKQSKLYRFSKALHLVPRI
jgi:chromosome segregation ATPase